MDQADLMVDGRWYGFLVWTGSEHKANDNMKKREESPPAQESLPQKAERNPSVNNKKISTSQIGNGSTTVSNRDDLKANCL